MNARKKCGVSSLSIVVSMFENMFVYISLLLPVNHVHSKPFRICPYILFNAVKC